jgi:hypothetical protein
MPMESKAQWRALFAKKMPFADRWANETKTPFSKLPKKVSTKKMLKQLSDDIEKSVKKSSNFKTGNNNNYTASDSPSQFPSQDSASSIPYIAPRGTVPSSMGIDGHSGSGGIDAVYQNPDAAAKKKARLARTPLFLSKEL